MELNRKQKVYIFRIVLIAAFGLMNLFVFSAVLNLNIIKSEYGLASFWLIILGVLIIGRIIFGKEFGSSRRLLKNLKGIEVINGHWTCPVCHAENADEFLAMRDATMNCEKCGQLVVREPGSVNFEHVSPSVLHRTKMHQQGSRIGLLLVWICIIIL